MDSKKGGLANAMNKTIYQPGGLPLKTQYAIWSLLGEWSGGDSVGSVQFAGAQELPSDPRPGGGLVQTEVQYIL